MPDNTLFEAEYTMHTHTDFVVLKRNVKMNTDKFDADLDELVRMGYNKDEVEFCYAVLVYDAELIKKHIALKTNPKVYVSGELAPGTGFRNDGTSYSALFSCLDFHYDAVVYYGVIDYWTGNEINKEQSARGDNVLNLLQAAAYLRLGKQLKTL